MKQCGDSSLMCRDRCFVLPLQMHACTHTLLTHRDCLRACVCTPQAPILVQYRHIIEASSLYTHTFEANDRLAGNLLHELSMVAL